VIAPADYYYAGQAYATEPGWIETYESAPFPEVSVPSNAPSGVTLSKMRRPLLIPDFTHLGPFSRSEITRLWWTMRQIEVADFSASIVASASWNFLTPVSVVGTGFSKSESDSEPLQPLTNWPLGIASFNAKFSETNIVGHVEYDAPGAIYISVSARSRADISFSFGDIYCDIDSPEDFYIEFGLGGYVYALSWVDFNPSVGPAQYVSSYDACNFGSISINRFNAWMSSYSWSNPIVDPLYVGGAHSVEPGFDLTQSIDLSDSGYKTSTVHVTNLYPPNFSFEKVTWEDWEVTSAPCSDCVTVITIPFEYFDGGTKYIKILSTRASADGNIYWWEEAADAVASISSGPSFSIRVKEYHEYDDGNGNPIYDKNTGAILRDPVTGETV